MATEQRVKEYVRAMIDREAASDYALARRIPSTEMWHAIDLVKLLDPLWRELLSDALASIGVCMLQPERGDLAGAARRSDAFHWFCDAMSLTGGDWRYHNVRDLRSLLGEVRGGRLDMKIPDEVLERAQRIRPVTAGQIRTVLNPALKQRFSAQSENIGGGDWRYLGKHRGREVVIDIDFGGRGDQLRYGVTFQKQPTGIEATRITYEGLIGLGHGWWDFVTADNLDASVILLCDLIADLAEIPDKIQADEPNVDRPWRRG